MLPRLSEWAAFSSVSFSELRKGRLSSFFCLKILVILLLNLQPYSLEYYKSLKQKMELLDFALSFHDGNAIMAVSFTLFNDIMIVLLVIFELQMRFLFSVVITVFSLIPGRHP